MDWISIKENEPDLGIPVLAYRSDGIQRVTHFFKSGVIEPKLKAFRFYQNPNYDLIVTHWMPLPLKPLKKVSEGLRNG